MRRSNCVAEFAAVAISSQVGRFRAQARQLPYEIERELAKLTGRSLEDLVISPSEAELYLPPIIRRYDAQLVFLLLPFSKIPYAMYDCVLAKLMAAGATVAAGVRASFVFRTGGKELHVVRVAREKRNGPVLVDSAFPNGERELEWPTFEHAVMEARSGYWVIGLDGAWRTRWI